MTTPEEATMADHESTTVDHETITEITGIANKKNVRHRGILAGLAVGFVITLVIGFGCSLYDGGHREDMPSWVACTVFGGIAMFIGMSVLYIRYMHTDADKQPFWSGIGISSITMGIGAVLIGLGSQAWHNGTELAINGVEAMMFAAAYMAALCIVQAIGVMVHGGFIKRRRGQVHAG